jgi:5,10-methylenetetrahydromethanopterin reductase
MTESPAASAATPSAAMGSRSIHWGIAIVPSEPPNAFVRTVRLAEELGFDSIWIPDYRLYRDVYVSLALVAQNTHRVRLGCAVTNPYTRHAAMTAVGICSVDELAGGRAVLGLGPGGLVLTMLDVDRRRPLSACREAVADIRRLLGRDPMLTPGEAKRIAGAEHLDFPARADLPVFIAATGLGMLTLAGEIADGVIVNVGVYPPSLEVALGAVGIGLASADPPRPVPELVCWLQGCAVLDDRQTALNAVKATAALTLGNSPAWLLETLDIEPGEAQHMRDVYYSEGSHAAAELVSDEVVDRFTIAGSPADSVRKIRDVIGLGFDEIIFLPDESAGNISTAMKTLAEEVMARV